MPFPRRSLLSLGLLALLLSGCALSGRGASPVTTPRERPRDPWVFRTVLDENPRMIVAALDTSLWVAYDATDCSLKRAWSGGVKFDGAVYTGVHGPQPTSIGANYLNESGSDRAQWSLRSDGDTRPIALDYGGYRIDGGELRLSYRAGEVHVEERPEYVEGVAPTLERRWIVSGLGPDRRLILDCSEMPAPLRVEGKARLLDGGGVELGDGESVITVTFPARSSE